MGGSVGQPGLHGLSSLHGHTRVTAKGGREGLQPQAQPQAASCKQAPTEESGA